MSEIKGQVQGFRFGTFEMDLQARELRRRGLRVKLQEKPFQILALLLEKSGEVVTRKELREKLWPDTFVGFDRSVNTAVHSVRRALGDSPANPRFLETRSRYGYRFIAPVEAVSRRADHIGQSPAFDSIAVLPFQNASGDPEMEYLGDGLTESIIQILSKLPEIRVKARATVFCYKERKIDPQDLGSELNVRALLTGKVSKRGEALLINVELVDTLRGWRLWGEEYNREWRDIFAVQEEIARRISDALRLRLTIEERKELSKQYTVSTEAYRSYLKGRYHWNKLTEEGLERGIAYFQQALEQDPAFALPYAGLADSHILFAFFGIRPAREVMPLAEAAARRALELDGALAEAHASLASVEKAYHWNWEAAKAEYRQALELNPNHAMTRRWYANFLCGLGKLEEAVREMERAMELDPLSLSINMEMAWIWYLSRDYSRAVGQASKTLEMEPRFGAAYHVLGLACEQMGKNKEAIRAFQKAGEISGGNPINLAGLAHALAGAHRKADARKILGDCKRKAKQSYIPPYVYAVLCLALGDKAQGLHWLEKACAEHDVWLVWILQDPRLDAVRREPRFQEVLRRMNLPV